MSEKLSLIRTDHPKQAEAGDVIYAIKAGQEYGILAADIAALGSSAQNSGTRLISGSVTWLSGLSFAVSECVYLINGTQYTSPAATVTLDAADGTHPRIDVIKVTTSSVAGETAGTAAADPAKPEVDPDTELELTFVTVAAGASTPTGISTVLLYGENAGDPTEWDATESTATARITLAATTDPYAGSNHIHFDSATSGDTVTLTAGSGNELSVGNMTALELHIKVVSAWANAKSIRVAFFYGVTRTSNWVEIHTEQFGFDASDTSAYQTVSILPAHFAFTQAIADSIKFEVSGGGAALQAYLDQVRIQTGVTIVNNFNGLTEDDLVNTPREFNATQYYGEVALTDAATIAWDLDSAPCASVTLTDNRTLGAPTNMRAGAFYTLRVIQDAGGTNTLAYNAVFLWPGGTAPTLSTGGDAVDILNFYCDGTNMFGVSNLDYS